MTSQPERPEIGQSIDANGVCTNYHEQGSGEPLLLIHGSGPGVTAWANWQFNIPVMAQKFRVLAPDMIGFGYTDPPKGGIRDKAVWVDHLAAFLDAKGIDKVSLVGNSFGGSLTLAFMIAHPDRVKRAVLMGAVGLEFPITRPLQEVWGYEPSLEAIGRAMRYLVSDESRLTEALIQSRYEASRRPAAHEPYAATFGPEPRQQHVKMLASREEDIAKLPHEVLILHGKLDQAIPVDVSVRLGNLIANSDVHLFAKCGHWVQIERAKAFNALVMDFMEKGLNL